MHNSKSPPFKPRERKLEPTWRRVRRTELERARAKEYAKGRDVQGIVSGKVNREDRARIERVEGERNQREQTVNGAPLCVRARGITRLGWSTCKRPSRGDARGQGVTERVGRSGVRPVELSSDAVASRGDRVRVRVSHASRVTGCHAQGSLSSRDSGCQAASSSG